MTDGLLTKRLHISGLTPSITPADLERRLAAFGTVKDMDGFGARDALGDPRKFAYVTMEIGSKELAKCLNVLSGSTWKGTKLRIGEAKLDFRERIARINSLPPRPVRPKRSHAHNYYGYASPNLPLSPLSPTTAAVTPGWVVTPSGRIVRPMRMRPERPLAPVLSVLTASKGKDGRAKAGKVKKRVKPPPIRARRRKIDPTKWDSVYLKGVFLDSVPVPLPTLVHIINTSMEPVEGGADEDEAMGEEADSEADLSDENESEPTGPPRVLSPPRLPASTQALSSSTNPERLKKGKALFASPALLHREKGKSTRKPTVGSESARATGQFGSNECPDEEDVEMSKQGSPAASSASALKSTPAGPQKLLKDLFAPREEETSFSLFDHLNVDLELEDDILGIGVPSSTPHIHIQGSVSQPVPALPQAVHTSTAISTSKVYSRVILDPSLPLLFPLPELLPHPYASSTDESVPSCSRTHLTSSCFLFPPTRSSHILDFLLPSNTFTRSPSNTSESIRAQWENEKGALTHEWKKAWREARGSRRGRRGEIDE
ncbi:hypothetical protein BS17DRAFT_810201 [Gyrodon lividus]|nr:hypothetical protein BS17DRAFT_810201 [Gyrodon lividus]